MAASFGPDNVVFPTATSDPTATSNKSLGTMWVNTSTGDTFVCTNATTNSNVWVKVNYTPPLTVEAFVVGGGAGGNVYNNISGEYAGAGGGGYTNTGTVNITSSATVTVAAGGASQTNGGTSSIVGDGSVTSYGGITGNYINGGAGGSGGGAGLNNGGSDGSNGGGGANGGVGQGTTTRAFGNPSGTLYAGGGGGGHWSGYTYGGAGGGGNGNSNSYPGVAPFDGTANTGGGGGGLATAGGAGYSSAGAGGSGIVIVRYSGTVAKCTGGTITNDGSYTYHTFTSSGILTKI